jgi:erythritol kinase
LLWLDGRSAGVLEQLQRHGNAQRVAQITRTSLNTSQQGVQLRWLAEHAPERLAQAASALHCKDWLYLCCTGLARTDWAEGIYTFGNPQTLAYDPSVLQELGLGAHERLLPALEDGLRVHAPLTSAAAAACGLPEGLPVVLAPLDVACATLGSGQLAHGLAHGVSVLGSAGIHTRLFDSLVAVPSTPQQGYLWPLGSTGLFQAARSQMAAALNVDWFAGVLGQAAQLLGAQTLTADALLQRLEYAATQAPAGSAIYHPFIADSGERSPLLAPLARAQFSGLSQSTSLGGLCRAVYEGLAFSARDAYEAMGAIPNEVCLVGGPARSVLLRQLFANVLQRPIRLIQRQEVGAAGAAMVATVALNLYPDLASVARHWNEASGPDLQVLPDDTTAYYDNFFEAYRCGYQHASPFWNALHVARQA